MANRFVPIDGSDHWQDLQAIHAVMAYPEDDALASERFWAPVWMDRVLGLPEDGELTVGRNDLMAMLQAPTVNDVLEKAQKRTTAGQIAGHLLMLCIGMDGEDLPVSIRRAGYLLEKYYARIRHTHGQVVRATIRTINAAWRSHGSVAPMWAASAAIRMEPAGGFESLAKESLAEFISWSEWFRRKGENLTPARQRNPSPILDPDLTWRFPYELVAPLPNDNLLKLPDWAQAALQEYRNES